MAIGAAQREPTASADGSGGTRRLRSPSQPDRAIKQNRIAGQMVIHTKLRPIPEPQLSNTSLVTGKAP